MTAVAPGRRVPQILSPGTWQALARTPSQEEELKLWLAGLPPAERRAFWAGVLLVDGKTTIRVIVERWTHLEGVAPTTAPAEAVHDFDAISCERCGERIDYTPSPQGGRPPSYCAPCKAEVLRERDRARRARLDPPRAG